MESRSDNAANLFYGLQLAGLLLLAADLVFHPNSANIYFIFHILLLLVSTNTIGWLVLSGIIRNIKKITGQKNITGLQFILFSLVVFIL